MNCTHDQTEFVPTPELAHHGKTLCATCGKFLRWEKKPETIDRERRTGAAVVRLRQDERLNAVEREFITSLDNRGPKLSPKQKLWLESIASKYV